MKRIIFLLILTIFMLSQAVPAFAAATWYTIEYPYTNEIPDSLNFSSFAPESDETPYEKFQTILNFNLPHGKEVENSFSISGDSYDKNSVYTLTFRLKYDKNALVNCDDVFITGTFDYSSKSSEASHTFSGDVIGHVVIINLATHDFTDTNSLDTANIVSIVLRLKAPEENFLMNFFFSTGGTGLSFAQSQDTQVADSTDYNNYNHESKPHIPKPHKQADVAVGVVVSTAGIAAASALSGTSVFGNASFNGTFNPSAPAQPAPSAHPSSSTPSSGVIGVIKDFFKNLFASIRDMLTDEGRSYASGRLAETLEDIIRNDINKE